MMVVACLLATLTVAIGSRSRRSARHPGQLQNAGLVLSVFILATVTAVAMTAASGSFIAHLHSAGSANVAAYLSIGELFGRSVQHGQVSGRSESDRSFLGVRGRQRLVSRE
ncbi:hypothetical protein RW1_035_00460 [Rhodococcus wratislaviensis NBRC 100605]|uniref:Uncharacterized protein n=1 Tax=Rhodococcus wratislaviensis NBRC 100605 TaxID=1219028 RepID=X0PUS0_RHOWR|nr:hypothetical protein RW1_035_00460 [Rhodococcus wratislaviensis NBRC 100605]